MSRYFYDDEITVSDPKSEAATERKAASEYCPECECHGYHATMCPEAVADEKGEA